MNLKIREIQCKSAIGKCNFPVGGWAINPYVGCSHGCVYCYARFIKRFTGHQEPWGTFVDVRVNIPEVLQKQLKSPRYKSGTIYIGTVTDPYQLIEKKYQLTRKILQLLKDYQAPTSILTKSDLILRDLDLLQQFKHIDVNFTVTTLDNRWKNLTEPYSPSTSQRLTAMKKLASSGIAVNAMVGPYWPFFTNPEALFKKFKAIGVHHVFSESFNTVGGNWTGVEKVLKKHYPNIYPQMKEILFNKLKYKKFYGQVEQKLHSLSQNYKIPITSYFAPAHAGKFK